MPIPANRAKIQLARGDYTNLIANLAEFAEGELSYAKDENLLYIKEEGELIRLEYVTRADLDAAVEDSIDLEVYGGEGLLTETGTTGSSPTTTLSIDEEWLKDKVGIADSNEPSGFVDKTTTVIAYRPVEQQFWLYPTGASAAIWCQGEKFTFTSYKFVNQPTSSGIYYIYLDENANLQIKSSPFNYKLDAPVAQIYWDQTAGEPLLLLDRRHGIAMDWSTQEFLETSNQFPVHNGLSIASIPEESDGSSDEQATFSLTNGVIFFQDIRIEISDNASPAPNIASNLFQQILSPAANLPVFYRDGDDWIYKNPDDYAFLTVGSIPVYNKFDTEWISSEVTNGNYFISYIIGTENTEYPVITIIGQSEYNDISAAEAALPDDLNKGELSNIHHKVLYKIIYKYDSSFTNSTKVAIKGYQDLRNIGGSSSIGTTDHGRLSGLGDDDHLQYVHIANDRTISANNTHSGKINVSNSTVSTNSGTGALTVSGGVGIQGNLNVDGDIGATLNGGNF